MSQVVANTVSFTHEVVRPSAVSFSFCCSFTGADVKNQIVVKSDLLEVYIVNPKYYNSASLNNSINSNGSDNYLSSLLESQQQDPARAYESDILTLIFSVKLYGIVAAYECLRLPESSNDCIAFAFIDTKQSVVCWDPSAYSVSTIFLFENSEVPPFSSSARVPPPRVCYSKEHDVLTLVVYEHRMYIFTLNPAYTGKQLVPFQSALDNARSLEELGREIVVSPFGAVSPLVADANLTFAFVLNNVADLGDMAGIVRIRSISALQGFMVPTLLMLADKQHSWEGRYSASRNTCSLILLSLAYDSASALFVPNVVEQMQHLPHESVSVLPLPAPLFGSFVISAHAIYHYNSHFIDLCFNTSEHGNHSKLFRAQDITPLVNSNGDEHGVNLANSKITLIRSFALSTSLQEHSLGYDDDFCQHYLNIPDASSFHFLLEYLIVLECGGNMLLQVEAQGNNIYKMRMKPLCEGVQASSLTSLSESLVFVGSKVADSCILQLSRTITKEARVGMEEENFLDELNVSVTETSAAESSKHDEGAVAAAATAAVEVDKEDFLFNQIGRSSTTATSAGTVAVSTIYSVLVRLVFPSLCPITGLLTEESKEGVGLTVTAGQGKAGTLTTVGEYLRPHHQFSPAQPDVQDPIVGVWTVSLDDTLPGIAANQMLTFQVGDSTVQGPRRCLLALQNLKKETRKLTRKLSDAEQRSAAVVSSLIENDPRATLALQAFRASLEQSSVLLNCNSSRSTHKSVLVVASSTTKTYVWTVNDVAVADLDAHLATLRNKDDGQVRSKNTQQLAKLYKLAELGKMNSTAITCLSGDAPTLLVANILLPFAGVLHVSTKGFVLSDGAMNELARFDLQESGVTMQPTDSTDTCIVQAVLQEPFLVLLTSDNQVITVQFHVTPFQTNWYSLEKLAIPHQDMLPATPVCSVGLSTMSLHSIIPSYMNWLQSKPKDNIPVSSKQRDQGTVDLLQDIFAETAPKESVGKTDSSSVLFSSQEANLSCTLLFICRTDRMDILLAGTNKLIMSCANPAHSQNVLSNVIDDQLKRDNSAVFVNNTLTSSVCSSPLITVEPRASYVMNVHVEQLQEQGNPLVFAQTDNGDIYVYQLFEYISAHTKESILKACSNVKLSLMDNLLARLNPNDYLDVHSRMQAYAGALIPLFPMRLRLLPLQLPVRVSLIQKQTLDGAVNSVRSRLLSLWNKYLRSIQTAQQKRKKRKINKRYELQISADEVNDDVIEFSDEDEHECRVKLAYLAQLTGTNSLNMQTQFGSGENEDLIAPLWSKFRSFPTNNLYSLMAFRVRSPAAASPSLLPILNPFSTCHDLGVRGVLLCMNNTLLTIKSRFGMPEPVLISTVEDERNNVNKPLTATTMILPMSKLPLIIHADINLGQHVATLPLSLPTAFAFKQAPFNYSNVQSNLTPFNRICHATAVTRNRSSDLLERRSMQEVAQKLPTQFVIDLTSDEPSQVKKEEHGNPAIKDELDDLFGGTSGGSGNNSTTTTTSVVKDELDNLFSNDVSKQASSTINSNSSNMSSSSSSYANQSLLLQVDNCVSALTSQYAYIDTPLYAPLLNPPLPESASDLISTCNGGVWSRTFIEDTPTHLSYHATTETIIVCTSSREEGFSQEDTNKLSVPLFALRYKIQIFNQATKELLLTYDDFEQDEAVTSVHSCTLSGKSVVCVSVATHNGPDSACKGRIVVLEPYYAEGISHDGYKQSFLKLRTILHKDKLPVQSLGSIDGFLAAGCGGKVFLYEQNPKKNTLVGRAFYPCQLAVVGIQSSKNLLVVSDAFQSVQVLVWDSSLRELTLLARHHASVQPGAVSMYVHGEAASIFVGDQYGNSQLVYYHPNRLSSRKYQRLAARAEFYLGSPVTACSLAFAPSPTRIADQLKTQLCALLSNYPNSLNKLPGGLDNRHASLADALRATRTSAVSLQQTVKENNKLNPHLHPLRTCLYNGTKAGSIVAMLPVDLFPHFPSCSRVFQELACVQPHVAGLDSREYRSWQRLLGVGVDTALTTRTEVYKYDVVDIDAVILLALVPMITQSEIAKEAGATAAAVIETVLNSFLAMRLK